jgi:thiol-disulfide isomerase/thioredoxin
MRHLLPLLVLVLLAPGAVSAKTLIGDAVPAVSLIEVSTKATKAAIKSTIAPTSTKTTALNKLGGGVLVFTFYSRYCRSCQAELPALHRAVKRANADVPKKERARIFVIVIDTPPPPAIRERLGGHTRWLLDRKTAARRAFVPRRFPCTYIAKAQRVRRINRGFGKGFERRVERWLRDLLPRRRRAPSR